MSFGGINGAGPQGAAIFGNQSATVAGAVPGQAGAPANGATPIFNASFESVLAAVSRGEVPLNLNVASSSLGGGAQNLNSVSLLQAIGQGIAQNGTNGLGVRAGPSPSGEGTFAVGLGSNNLIAGATTDSGAVTAVDLRQVSSVSAMSSPNQYCGN